MKRDQLPASPPTCKFKVSFLKKTTVPVALKKKSSYYSAISCAHSPASRGRRQDTVRLGYYVMTGTEYFVSIQASVVITQECNATVNSDELIGTTEQLTTVEVSYKPMSL
jgi:hypothetical protein